MLDYPLIYESKIQVGHLLVVEGLALLLGLGLWWPGWKLWRRRSGWPRAGGAGLLLLAGLLTLAWLGLNTLVLGTALGVL